MKWISVKEGLPEFEVTPYKKTHAVLAMLEGQVEIASYHDGHWHDWANGWFKIPIGYRVTHWMPLPPPPEADE